MIGFEIFNGDWDVHGHTDDENRALILLRVASDDLSSVYAKDYNAALPPGRYLTGERGYEVYPTGDGSRPWPDGPYPWYGSAEQAARALVDDLAPSHWPDRFGRPHPMQPEADEIIISARFYLHRKDGKYLARLSILSTSPLVEKEAAA